MQSNADAVSRQLETERMTARVEPPRLLGVWGHLAILGWVLVMVALLPAGRLPWLAGLILLLAAIQRGEALSALSGWRLWLLLASIVTISPFIIGKPDMAWMGISLSREGLAAGVSMALRALCISLAFAASIGALSVTQMTGLFERIGLRGMGFALGVALNMLTLLGDVVSVTYHSCRLRGGFRRNIWGNSRRMLIAILVSSLRHADDVVLAASARAFDLDSDSASAGEGPRARRRPVVAVDVALFAALAAASVALMWGT